MRYMKPLAAAALVVALTAACGGGSEPVPAPTTTAPGSVATTAAETAPTATTAAVAEPVAAPTTTATTATTAAVAEPTTTTTTTAPEPVAEPAVIDGPADCDDGNNQLRAYEREHNVYDIMELYASGNHPEYTAIAEWLETNECPGW